MSEQGTRRNYVSRDRAIGEVSFRFSYGLNISCSISSISKLRGKPARDGKRLTGSYWTALTAIAFLMGAYDGTRPLACHRIQGIIGALPSGSATSPVGSVRGGRGFRSCHVGRFAAA